MRPLLFAGFLLLLGACLQAPEPTPPIDPSILVPRFLPPVALSDQDPGAEPVVAVASDGTIYVEGIGSTLINGNTSRTNVNKLWRSTDGGATWTDVTPAGLAKERSNDGFVAVGNGDTVYLANVFQLTFQVFRSMDRGETWEALPVPRLPALMHRHWILPVGENRVHLVIEAFPPEFATYLGGQPPPVDPLGSANQGLWYSRSEDRGSTWTTPVRIDPNVNFAGQGNLVVDGQHLYVVRYEEPGRTAYEQTYEEGQWYLVSSHDGGAAWARSDMFPLTTELAAAIPATAADANGTLYTAWSQETGGVSRLHYSWSNDAGVHWEPPRALALGNGTHAMPWIAARVDGNLGLLWYHADAAGRASKLDAPWTIHYALVAGPDTQAPLAREALVTPEPIHHGNICAKGPACAAPEDRSLLDYPWMVFGPDGTAHLAFASTEWDRPSAFAVFAREAEPFAFSR